LARVGCSGAGSVFALLRGLVRLALLGSWSSSWSLLGSRLGATPWPHLGRWFFGEATHRVGKDRRLVSPARGLEREGIRRSSERIAARGDWIQLTHAGAWSKQLEDHTRWKGLRQTPYVCPWARLTSRKLLSALFAVYTCIYCIRYSSALLCSLAPHYYCINKPQLLNVSARFVFLSLARHDACLRISVRNLFIWSGPTLVIPLGYAGSESAIATRFGQSRPRVNFPGSRTTWVLR